MTEYQNRNRFIPFRKADVIEMCINDSRLSKHNQNLFRQLCHILGSLIHFEFHHQVEMLKDCYSPFNPNQTPRWCGGYLQFILNQLILYGNVLSITYPSNPTCCHISTRF